MNIVWAGRGFGMFFFSLKKVKIIPHGFEILPSWIDASALLKEVLLYLNAQSAFPTKSILERHCFIQSTFPSEEALHAEKNGTV